MQYLDKGILPLKVEAIDAFLGRAERTHRSATRFNPTLPFTYHDEHGVSHKVQPEYGYGCNQFPDERVRQLYGADVSWVPVVGLNPKERHIAQLPITVYGTCLYIMDHDHWNNLAPLSIMFTPRNHPLSSKFISHERVHGVRDRPFLSDDGLLHTEFYAYAACGNVASILFGADALGHQLNLNPGILTLGAQIMSQSLRSVLAYFDFKKTLKNAEMALSEEFGTRGARYVIGRASFGEAKEIAGCKNSRGLEELLQNKAGDGAGDGLRWELLQQKLEAVD